MPLSSDATVWFAVIVNTNLAFLWTCFRACMEMLIIKHKCEKAQKEMKHVVKEGATDPTDNCRAINHITFYRHKMALIRSEPCCFFRHS